MTKLFKYLKPYWLFTILGPLCMILEVVSDLMLPSIMAVIVDDGVMLGNMDVVVSNGIKMLIWVGVGVFGGIMSGVFSNLAAQNFGNDLRKDVFKSAMSLSFEQTDKFTTGSLVTRISNDVTQVQNMVMMSMRMLVRTAILFGGGLVMLYQIGGQFMLAVAILLPIILILIFLFLRRIAPMFSTIQKKLDSVNNVVQENVNGARVVKAYVQEGYESKRFLKVNEDYSNHSYTVGKILSYISPLMNIIMYGAIVLIIYIGGSSVAQSYVDPNTGVTAGEVMAALTYIMMILMSILFLAMMFQTLTRAIASAKRLNEVLDSKPILLSGNVVEGNEVGTIEFKNVSFRYPGASGDPIINGISFSINKGETLAILGSTGSGKSTIVNLIPRFYDVTDGEIIVDGVNVKDYDLKTLRNKISIVLQKAELFSDTIENNIRWGKADASPEEVETAAKIAQADNFITSFNDGYKTMIQEKGSSLSGGQKQRISIARALIKKPEILIFDDSTSALDLATEAKLYKALGKSAMTKIIIAQRVASVKGADRIAVIDNGKIVAIDKHENLMKNCDIYIDIYNSQLKKGSVINDD